ncbi:hypothetical protein [Aliarcobacter butzleri]|uniref:hypothetical protein n=1 Tax=Aliarcobacter butzleri TaxID=28197 RepID=UPI00263D600B|nr:hypothetical protein [Aliarcobacter butzleri]MDN5085490.1 hypothetical protein [Aliarcobacter butzleri]
MDDKNLELIPDKDGFLFEIEDHSYLLHKFIGWLIVINCVFGLLFIFFGGDILAMRNEGHRGYLLLSLGLPYILFQGIRILIYIRKDKKYKIQFYKDYIYKESRKFKLPLCDIEEGYVAKYNIKEYQMRPINSYYLLISLIGTTMIIIWAINVIGIIKISIGLIFLFCPIVVGIFIYSLLKRKTTFKTNSLILIDKKDDTSCIDIPLNIISKKDKEKIINYIKQYLHTDINKLEKVIIAVSIFPYSNIKFDERI